MTGLSFAQGVILSPNVLVDNSDIQSCLSQRNVIKYLNEEGIDSFVIRGFGLSSTFSVLDYFQALPDDYIFSSVVGSPKKCELSVQQEADLIARLQATDRAIQQFSPQVESIQLSADALRTELFVRLADDALRTRHFEDIESFERFRIETAHMSSRSQWYQVSDMSADIVSTPEAFKAELIDPAYNSLFVKRGEAFVQDDIRVLSGLPTPILDGTVLLKSFRNERAVLDYGLTAIEWISSLGSTELMRFLTDKALDYCEQKVQASGEAFLSRKNWFGMYDVMRRKLGLEIK